MELLEYIRSIGAPNHMLTMRELKPLSDLSLSERAAFQKSWPVIKPERRVQIVQAMVDLSEDNVDLNFQSVLLWCLDDEHAPVRALAIEGLWESESKTVLRRMIELLRQDGAREVRIAAATGLSRYAYMAEMGELDDDDAEQLRRALLSVIGAQSQPSELRRRALESAGYFGEDEEVQRQIELAYKADDISLQESALMAMGRSMQARWLPTIAQELESKSPALRYEAARAVGEMAEEARSLVARLAKLLVDSDTEVALAAIWAMGQIGGEAAQRALRQVSKSQDQARSQAAAEALSELSLDQGIVGGDWRQN